MATDIQELAEAYGNDPSAANREALVMGCIPLVRAAIDRLRVPGHCLATYEDLQGAGLLGLMEALERYDLDRGTRFASYAYLRIRGAVVDYLRLIDTLPRERRRDVARAQKAYDRVSQVRGAEPDDQEVADFLGITMEDYQGILQDARLRDTRDLFHQVNGDEGMMLLEAIPNEDAEAAFEAIDQRSMGVYLRTILETLPDREQHIVNRYYFEGLTFREIAGELQVSEARISQIMGNIFRKLKDRVGPLHRAAA